MYTFLRQLADSWAALSMLLVFLGIVVWAFRPGTKELYKDISNTPFRNDEFKEDDNG
ncbi:MAG: CcoQ/FixQ family Cbb3-type cytochrome c oxidase assembly chaperone [Rhodobacteraceae bacterium]|nr:MAG: CcoQ/FixQ family Cbb3-type cytochrome c oxidase assembly chaperone [Paracoccaceae bacterium]